MEMNPRWRSVKGIIFFFSLWSFPLRPVRLKNSNRKLSFAQAQTQHFLKPSAISSGADLGGQKAGTTKGFSQQTQPSCDPAGPPRRNPNSGAPHFALRGLPGAAIWGRRAGRAGRRHRGARRSAPSRRSGLGSGAVAAVAAWGEEGGGHGGGGAALPAELHRGWLQLRQ